MTRLLVAAAIAFTLLSVPAIPLGLDRYLPVPEDNPLTPAKVTLGRRLFFESVLSRDGTVACASCHQPDRAFTDGRAVAIGAHQRAGTRSAPSIINRAYGRSQFWDGRAATLEEQVLEPIGNPQEMDFSPREAAERLAGSPEYRAAFDAAFGQRPDSANLSRALASYVRTILAGNSPYDRYAAGDPTALDSQARQGMKLFRGKAGCAMCHAGPTLSDERFHNTGVAWRNGVWPDVGRFGVTRRVEDRGAFKTPTLREIARTAPYMHDGSLTTLEEVIDFYDRGGRPNPNLDPEIHPLKLDGEEKRALVAFLETLSGTVTQR